MQRRYEKRMKKSAKGVKRIAEGYAENKEDEEKCKEGE